MRNLATPGVIIEEIASFPPSVAPVGTAIPAFVGHVANDEAPDGTTNLGVARRVTSLLEFETFYGRPAPQSLTVSVIKNEAAGGGLLSVNASFTNPPEPFPTQPRLLYHAMQFYFANGGGPCYVHAIAAVGAGAVTFGAALAALEAVDEVTILCFPDALALGVVDYGSVVTSALQSSNRTRDRVVIADVPHAHPGAGTDIVNSNELVTTAFRERIALVSEDFLKYGASYYPFINTSIGILVNEDTVTIDSATSNTITLDANGVPTAPVPLLPGDPLLSSTDVQGDATANPVTPGEKAVADAIRSLLRRTRVTLPPSPAMSGVCARVDRTKGVHYAPANVGIVNAIEPALPMTNDLNGQLNVDPTSGKSVNVIRSFSGRGTLVWGARTLAGNSNDWRFFSVRRTVNFIEESIEKAIGPFVFAPNDANTWVRVRTMIENFLTVQWRAGALVGPKPEDAFNVRVGINQTMTAEDVLNGLMIVRVGMAISRPAEFIVLEFVQEQQKA